MNCYFLVIVGNRVITILFRVIVSLSLLFRISHLHPICFLSSGLRRNFVCLSLCGCAGEVVCAFVSLSVHLDHLHLRVLTEMVCAACFSSCICLIEYIKRKHAAIARYFALITRTRWLTVFVFSFVYKNMCVSGCVYTRVCVNECTCVEQIRTCYINSFPISR